MDETAVECAAIGKMGDRWFRKRVNSGTAAAVWKKCASILEKDLKIKYGGLDAGKVAVEPEALLAKKDRATRQ